MKVLVISYSLTGNNGKLASSLASRLDAKHIQIIEEKQRNNGSIAFDILFNRIPRIKININNIEEYDLIVFVAPVWMGCIAAPLRACFSNVASKLKRYAFISISGGADGPNPKLENELIKRLRKTPELVLDMHIADLLPKEPKPTRDVTSKYQITEEDTRNLTDKVIEAIYKN
jgi:hypothetical protein